jgi:hypothetical protein
VIGPNATLENVCFAVAAALNARGISGVLTGGSTAAIYAPEAYMSDDADFVLDASDKLADAELALHSIGFQRVGKSRIFSHPSIAFTVDLPKGPLAVGGDYVQDTCILERGGLRLRILTRTDCVRDRLAHFYYWDDYTALNAAVALQTGASTKWTWTFFAIGPGVNRPSFWLSLPSSNAGLD